MNKKLKISDLELNVIDENTKTDSEKVQAVKKAYTKAPKKAKKKVEPKNYYLFLKHTPTQENFSMILFSSKDIALENKSIWDKKNKVCILVSVEEMNEFILSKK